jgi:hypothetical protein
MRLKKIARPFKRVFIQELTDVKIRRYGRCDKQCAERGTKYMAVIPLIVFDVNETLLDLETMEPWLMVERSHKGLNSRAESCHLPLRKRERVIQDFRSWSGLRSFVSIYSAIRNLFFPFHSHRSAARAEFVAKRAATGTSRDAAAADAAKRQ